MILNDMTKCQISPVGDYLSFWRNSLHDSVHILLDSIYYRNEITLT